MRIEDKPGEEYMEIEDGAIGLKYFLTDLKGEREATYGPMP